MSEENYFDNALHQAVHVEDLEAIENALKDGKFVYYFY